MAWYVHYPFMHYKWQLQYILRSTRLLPIFHVLTWARSLPLQLDCIISKLVLFLGIGRSLQKVQAAKACRHQLLDTTGHCTVWRLGLLLGRWTVWRLGSHLGHWTVQRLGPRFGQNVSSRFARKFKFYLQIFQLSCFFCFSKVLRFPPWEMRLNCFADWPFLYSSHCAVSISQPPTSSQLKPIWLRIEVQLNLIRQRKKDFFRSVPFNHTVDVLAPMLVHRTLYWLEKNEFIWVFELFLKK